MLSAVISSVLSYPTTPITLKESKIHEGGALDRKRKLLEKQKNEKQDLNDLVRLKFHKKLSLMF